eukprot:TRINITY_DN2042_c0_g1_i1.p1 TRINITY_DN2042_c0_g1~~TRINITY_DN2042_c0_g1_i1.p1  ORF type:complete len:197 (-),score=53.70 TRINITY_DN2042_c0_g1_i1:168-758(-)
MGSNSTKLSKQEMEMLKETESSTQMDKKELIREYRNFKLQYPSGYITLSQFTEMSANFLTDEQYTTEYVTRLFNAFDSDRSGSIDFSEFMLAMAMSSSDNPEDKLKFCFKSLDLDNNGYLDRQEISYAVNLIFDHNPDLKDRVPDEVNSPEKVVSKIFESVDKNGDGNLDCDELLDFLVHNPHQFSYLGLGLIFLS